MGNSRRLAHIGCVYLCLLYLVLPLTVEAARKVPVVRPASGQDVFVKSAGTPNEQVLDINRHWGEVIDVPPGKTTLPVKHTKRFKWPSVKSGLKALIKSRGNIYAAVGSVAVGYMIDAIPVPGVSVTPEGVMQKKLADTVFGMPYYGQLSDDVIACSSTLGPGAYQSFSYWHVISPKPYVSNGFTYYNNCSSSGRYMSRIRKKDVDYQVTVGGPTPFDDADFDALLSTLDSAPQNIINDALKNYADVPGSFDYPDSEHFDGPPSYQGQPTTTTTTHINPDGSTNVDLSEKTTNYDFSYNTNPLAITVTTTTTTNNYTNGVKTGTTTQTDASTKPEEQPKEKVDCELMPTHCKWIDWTKEPPPAFEETDLPVEDVDKPASVSVGPSGSCPPPKVISGEGIQGFKSFEFKFDPVCDLFSILRPIVIGVCSLVACFILAWRYN